MLPAYPPRKHTQVKSLLQGCASTGDMEGLPAWCGGEPCAQALREHGQGMARWLCECFLKWLHAATVQQSGACGQAYGGTARRAGEGVHASPFFHEHASLERDCGRLSPGIVQEMRRSTSSSSVWRAHIWPTVGQVCARNAQSAVVVGDDLSLSLSLYLYRYRYAIASMPGSASPVAAHSCAAATLPPAPTLHCAPNQPSTYRAMPCHDMPALHAPGHAVSRHAMPCHGMQPFHLHLACPPIPPLPSHAMP